MEDDGFIFRKQDEEDKRVVMIYLSPAGKKLKAKIEETVLEFNNRLFKHLDIEQLRTFEKVTNVIKEEARIEIDKHKI